MIPKAPKHNRIKPKRSEPPTRLEKTYISHIASIGCLACGKPANVHHIMGENGMVGDMRKLKRRDHRFIVPLCHDHHQGSHGVHGLGSERAFNEMYGIDLIEWCINEWIEFYK